MHGLCATQYVGSHMCHVAEYYRTQNATPLPTGGAWADGSGYAAGNSIEATIQVAPVNAGRYLLSDPSFNCNGWSGTTSSGAIVQASGPTTASCNVARPVVCCQ